MAAGDAQRRAGNEHARAGNFAAVDAVADSDVSESVRTDIANCCETGEKSEACVLAPEMALRGMEIPRPLYPF